MTSRANAADGSLDIMIVDDDPVVRRALERAVAAEPRMVERGVRVRSAADGRKALAMIEVDLPSVLIIDLFMPRMDGFALCRALRQSPATDALPIILISGVYKEQALVADIQAEVLAKFLAKPIDVTRLVDLISEVRPAHTRSNTLVGQPTLTAIVHENPLQSGSLGLMTVPRVILAHAEAGSTGTVLLVRGQQRKELFFRAGRTVSAESNIRQEALGNLLVSRGVIGDDQLTFLLAEAKLQGKKLGELIVELGWLSPEDVLRFLGAQARKRVADCLRWTEGSYSFIEGDQFNERVIEHEFDVERLIFTALARTAAPEPLSATLTAQGAKHLRVSPRFGRYRSAFEAVFGPHLATDLQHETSIGALLMRGDAPAVMLAIESLLLTGLGDLVDAQSEAISEWEQADPSGVFSLNKLGGEAPPPFAPAALPEIDEAFADEGPVPVAMPGAPSAAIEDDVSGYVSLTPETILAKVPAASSAEDKRQEVLREYLAIHGKSLYEVLGIPASATTEAIIGAYENKTERFAPGLFPREQLGPDAAKFTAITTAHDRAFRVLCDPGLRKGYDESRRSRPADNDVLSAELAFSEGMALAHENRFEAGITRLETAIERRGDQAVYHAHLGWLLFQARGAAAAARARREVEQAIALDPDLVDAHVFLGRLAAEEGDPNTARTAFENALDRDPTCVEAFDALIGAYTDAQEHERAERLYRHVIGALGERDLPLRRRLWRELAELYERRFANFASARVAYEMAARLAPGDAELQHKVVQLNAHDLGRWRELARALTAEWRLHPDDLASGHALLDLFLRVGQHDAAIVAATALVLRGATVPDVVRLAENHRPRLLGRAAGPLDPSVLLRARHRNEDSDLDGLFSLLAEEGLLPGFTDAEVGVDPKHELEPERLPVAFGKVLRYMTGLFAIPQPPRLFVHESLAQDARLADTRPVALLTGTSLLQATDTVELGFRLARALSFTTAGRVAGSARTGRQLRPYVLATMAMARRTLKSPSADVDAARTTLEGARPAVRTRLADLGGRLMRDRSAINLSTWARSLNRTATRMGLLLSGDPLRVGRAVAEEEGPEALESLIDFMLSLEHIDLRQELGLAAVV